MNKKLLYIAIIILVLFLLFAPCSAGGRIQYNGIRGCATGYDSALDAMFNAPTGYFKHEMKEGSAFFGLINWN